MLTFLGGNKIVTKYELSRNFIETAKRSAKFRKFDIFATKTLTRLHLSENLIKKITFRRVACRLQAFQMRLEQLLERHNSNTIFIFFFLAILQFMELLYKID